LIEKQLGRATSRRLVWDLPLRLFHWLFAASVSASWATAQLGVSWMEWHLRLGYWLMGLLIFRLVWGFFGPRHARFSSFLVGPRRIWSYARGLTGARTAINSVGRLCASEKTTSCRRC
jgi:cytochrome b